MKPLKLTHFKALLFFVFLFGVHAQSQPDTSKSTHNYNTNKDTLLPDKSMLLLQYLPQYETAADRANDSATERRLVDLALAQPQIDQAVSQNKILNYQLEKQRRSWLNLLSLSSSLNDQTFAAHPNNNAYVYPKYFFGVSIPLGLIVSSGTDIKITKESQVIAKDQETELRKSITAQVKTNYREYRAYSKLLALESQAADDEQSALLQLQQNFKDGKATFEQYNDASKKYNEEIAKAINLQLSQDLVKVEIEKLIGRKMEDIFK